MKDTWVKKGLVVSVILLFIGVAVAPSINFNVVKASVDNDLVEVTTKACGIKGYGNTTVKLTRQQYQNLEQYLVDFRARLNQTTTREEMVPIFKEAVVELNKYGLLPKGMNIQQTQKLVTGGYQNDRIGKILKRFHYTNDYLIKSNFLCLITGQGNRVYIEGVIPFIQECIMIWLGLPSLNYWVFFGRMIFGFGQWVPEGESEVHPATGWVYTNGLTGIKEWNGSFTGGCRSTLFAIYIIFYIGAVGFTGMGVTTNLDSLDFFIGSALWTRIRSV